MTVNPDEIKPKEMSDKEWLTMLADGLDNAERTRIGYGSSIIDGVEHETEGDTIVQMTDELARDISFRIRKIAEKLD
ncbi:hypothetical protein [Paenibacillus dakarensis]|uniref:hypothetical protein n=1 Tax=Paenibacillus dakarensis TaxID=1527293 RepID=UPI0006D59E24|nr:hypothetical protein [Paenibacillus dakarensis]